MSLLSALLEKDPTKNRYAGYTPEYDDDGKVVGYRSPTGDYVDKSAAGDLDSKGTGALERPSFWTRWFNPQDAQRIYGVNAAYEAMGPEEQQRYLIGQQQARDVVRRAVSPYANVSPDDVDAIAASMGTKVVGGGMSSQDYNTYERGVTGAKGGVGVTEGQADIQGAQSNKEEQTTFNQLHGGRVVGEGRVALAKLGGARATGELGLVPGELANRASQLQLEQGNIQGQIERQPDEQRLLKQQLYNELAKAEKVTPNDVELAAIQAKYHLNKEPANQEILDQLRLNKLKEAQVESKNLVGADAAAQATKDSADNIYKTRRNELATQQLVSQQPPSQLQAPYLYTFDPYTLKYKLIPAFNQLYRNNMIANMGLMADPTMRAKLGLDGGAASNNGLKVLPGGFSLPDTYTNGSSQGLLEPSAPATTAIIRQTPTFKPSVAINPIAAPAPQQSIPTYRLATGNNNTTTSNIARPPMTTPQTPLGLQPTPQVDMNTIMNYLRQLGQQQTQ